MLFEARERRWEAKIEKSNENQGQSWKLIWDLVRKRSSNSPLFANGKWWYAGRDKAERAAEYLEQVFTNTKDSHRLTKARIKKNAGLILASPQMDVDEISLSDLKA